MPHRMLRSAALAPLVLLATMAAMRAEDRPAEVILEEYDAVSLPRLDTIKRKTARAIQEVRSKRQKALNRRADLALELYRAHPDHERVAELMAERWETRLGDPKKVADVGDEVIGVLADAEDEALLKEAAFVKASLALRKNARSPAAALPTIEEFARRAPEDERGAMLLYTLAGSLGDPNQQARLYDRVAADYPGSTYAEEIKQIREAGAESDSPIQANAIGKPFRLQFVDAISGNPVSIQALKGKVVVIDFWATWCGPCVAEMPRMKELYRKYRPQGVEFIGVSLDEPRSEGGYARLVEFVESKEIPWPQYYQGAGWKSEFSGSWDIKAIPAVFLVDVNGRLSSTKARGKLDVLIPALLERAKKGVKR